MNRFFNKTYKKWKLQFCL